MPKIVVVLPVYNEEKMLENVLSRIAPRCDLVVCVNDGSTDRSPEILQKFARKRKNTYIVNLSKNSGMAGALKAGFQFTLYLEKKGIVKPDDIVVTIDADGQHKPEYIPELAKYMNRQKTEVVLTHRDFSAYPLYKVWGNRFLTFTNSALSGHKYQDVESGLRLLRVKTLPTILSYYTGIKYSCAQEIALITARAGFRVDNDFWVEIAYYRPGTTFSDGFIVLGLSLWCWGRMLLRIRKEVEVESAFNRETYLHSIRYWKKK